MSYGQRFILCAGVHALSVSVALAITFAAVRMAGSSPAWLNRAADILVVVLCLPLQPFVLAGRVGMFFVFLPVNTVAYASLASFLWGIGLRHGSISRARG